MKKILFLIILLSFLHSYADAQIALTGNITTIGISSYPTHIDSLGKGGYMIMPTTAARDNIPTLRRKKGMLVYVQDIDVLYRLGSATLDNSNWVEVSLLSATSNIQTFLASPTSANLSAAVTNDVGTGSLVFSNTPTLTNTTLSGTLTLTTPLSVANGGTGTNAATGTGFLVLSTSPALTGTPTAITALASSNDDQIATTAFVKSSITNSSAPDATATTKGIIRLTNDLGGSAALPTVNSVGGVISSTITTIASSVLSATSDNTPSTIVKRDNNGGFSTGTITGTLSGTASGLTTPRTIGISGDITYTSASFDGTGNVTGVGTLTNTGVTANTYGSSTITSTSVPIITVDSKGRITSASTINIPSATITVTGLLSSTDYENFNRKLDDISEGIGIEIVGTETGGIGETPRRGISISGRDADAGNKGIIQLAGDLTGTADLPRINTVGGVLSSTITTVASSVLSATENNTASTIVKRDGSGGFAAGAVTTTSVVSSGNISSTSLNTGTLTATSITTGTLKVTGGNYTTTNMVLTNDGSGNAIWQTPSGGITGVGTITTTAYATTGAAVSGNDLVLAAASSTSPGILTTETQTIAGNKIFSGTLSSTSLVLTGNLTSSSIVTNTLRVIGGSFTTTNAVLTNDGAGYATWSSNGLYTLNGISAAAQTFSTTTAPTSTSPSFTSTGTVHTLNIPSASVTGTTAGLLSNTDYQAFNAKQVALTAGAGSGISISGGTISATGITSGNLSATAGILNTQLANSSITLGSTSMSLGGTFTNVTGLSTVTSTSINTGTLTATSLVTNTLKVTGGNYTLTNAVLTSDGNGNATWANNSNGLYTLNGISAASQIFSTTSSGTDFSITSAIGTGALSTTATHAFNLPDASLTNRGVITTGTQTIAGQKSFANAVTNSVATNAGSSTNIDFSLSNLAYTSASPGPGSPGTMFTLTNMKDGGTYTLAVQGTTSGTASFTASNLTGITLTGVNVGNYESVSGKQTVYTFVVMGTTFYYSMVTEL